MTKSLSRLIALGLTTSLVLAGVAYSTPTDRVRAGREADPVEPPDPVDDNAVANGASLHNPSFDNHFWYEFSQRYDPSYPSGSWVPDDDTPGGPQDWVMWFQDGTAIVECDPESAYAHTSEGVQMRPIDWGEGAHQLAGLYQEIPNTTPCLTYQFQMYAQSRPEIRDKPVVLQVGIDKVGFHPTSETDPAVHSFPATTVWGTSQAYKWSYGLLSVTAEALDEQITVFTYADAPGGRYHRILWDTGSFQDVTPDLVSDPDNPPVNTSGITSGPSVGSIGSTSATVNWVTSVGATAQVYYRSLGGGSGTPSDPLTYTLYLPLIVRQVPWSRTALVKSSATSHQVVLSDLKPGTTYEYFVASRGVSGGACVTWVSNKGQFTTTN